MKQSIFSVLAVLSILFASCGGMKGGASDNSAELAKLTGHRWQLIELNGKAVAGKINGKMPYLDFIQMDNRYSATGGCNIMNGSYSFSKKKGSISFTTGISTMMACEDMESDRALSAAFAQTNNFTIVDGILALNKGKNALAKFKAVETGNELTGTWELDYIQGSATPFEQLYPNDKPTLTYDAASKKLVGKGGCNTYNASVEINGRNIKVGPVASTRMACPGEGEPLFFQSLQKVNGISVHEDQLTLIVGDIATMRFKKK